MNTLTADLVMMVSFSRICGIGISSHTPVANLVGLGYKPAPEDPTRQLLDLKSETIVAQPVR